MNENFDVLVTRLGVNEVRVDTTAPLILDIEDFGFEAGIAKLKELANLESISPIVSATVSLTFERQAIAVAHTQPALSAS